MPISDYLRALRSKIGTDAVLMPGVSALIFNDADEVLLHRSADDGKWYTIGGAIDPGETPAAAAERESLEETGLRVSADRIVGVYADPLHTYPNGDRVHYVITAFACRIVGGQLAADEESIELRFFAADALPPDLLPTHRHRVLQSLNRDDRAYFQT
jgi:8-oxo-dGTP pyrophosphatase MutT (NUDIX family)